MLRAFLLCYAFLALFNNEAFADCNPYSLSPCDQDKSAKQEVSTLSFDGLLHIDVHSKTDELGKVKLSMEYKDINQLGLNSEALKANLLERTNFYSYSNFATALGYLQSRSAQLSIYQKELLLSMIGSDLWSGFSANGVQQTNMDLIYSNAKAKGLQGGVCGDIHLFLSQVAQSLGFSAVGTSSLMWQQDPNQSASGGHTLSFFKDSQTGQYYFQNYSQIYATGQSKLTSAIDVATKVMGGLTDTAYIESRPGVIHAYMPATTQYVQNIIKNSAQVYANSLIHLGVDVGNDSKKMDLQIGNKNIRAFAGASELKSSEGLYQLSYLGVIGEHEALQKYENKLLDEVGYRVQVIAGGMNLNMPTRRISENSDALVSQSSKQANYFVDTNIKGQARINQTTGKIELSAASYDINTEKNQDLGARHSGHTNLKLGVDQKILKNTWVEIERRYDLIPSYLGENAQNSNFGLKTTYDKLGVLYDARAVDPKVYLKIGSDIYALEGLNKMSALGVKESIAKAIPFKGGTFTVVADYFKIVQNKSQDPFYENSAVKILRAQFEEKFAYTKIQYGFGVSRSLGSSITPVGVLGPVSLDMSSTQAKTKVFAFIGVPLN